MNILYVVFVLFVVGFVLAIFRTPYSSTAGAVRLNPRNTGGSKARKAVTARSRYRATSIVQGKAACRAAKALGDRRFLDADRVTPRIPMPECDSARCNCTYLHLDDRRNSEEDRRHPNMLRAELYDRTGAEDRRLRKRGRRRTDWA